MRCNIVKLILILLLSLGPAHSQAPEPDAKKQELAEQQNTAALKAASAAADADFKARPKFYQRCAMPVSLTLQTQDFRDTANIDWCDDVVNWESLGDRYLKIEAQHAAHHIDLKLTMPNGDVFQAENLALDETVFPKPSLPCHKLHSKQSEEVLRACVRPMRVGPMLEVSAFQRPAAEVAKATAKAMGWRLDGVELLGKVGNATYSLEVISPKSVFYFVADEANCEANFPSPNHVVFSCPAHRAELVALQKRIADAKSGIEAGTEAAKLREQLLVTDHARYQDIDLSDIWLEQAIWTMHASTLALELERNVDKPSKRLDDALALALRARAEQQRFNAAIVPVEINKTLIDIYLARKAPELAHRVLLETETGLIRAYGPGADALADVRTKRLKILTALGQHARAERLLQALLFRLDDDETRIAGSTLMLTQHLREHAAGVTDTRTISAMQLADSLFGQVAFYDVDIVLKTDLIAYRDLLSQRLERAETDQDAKAIAAISKSIFHLDTMLASEEK
jgi:hypothetical protein